MKLTPYRDVEKRWFKVCKHVFNPGEGWWDVLGDLAGWTKDWHALRVVGCFNGADGYRVLAEHLDARVVADRNHSSWIEVAERSCDEALLHGHVYNARERGRRCYVGDAGVVVIVAPGDNLVTCFRPKWPSGMPPEARLARAVERAEARYGLPLRAAVRRNARQASLSAAKPVSERDDA